MVSNDGLHRLSFAEAEALCVSALHTAGANAGTVTSLTRATLAAEARGKPAVGLAHLVDYLDSFRDGRLNPDPVPEQSTSRSGVITVDADGGVAQFAFDRALEDLIAAVHETGVAVLSIRNSYSGGEIGYYAARAAEAGLIAMACGNSAALMATHGARGAVTGTNPLAFALPHARGPRLFDQASSATAWVKIREAAETAAPLPGGWAIDGRGEPTTDAAAALEGAVLPFGGVKGGNMAFMVEMLAALSGAAFSLDAAPFDSGDRSPGLGVFVLVLDPAAFDPGYPDRAEAHLTRLAREHGVDFGRRRTPPAELELSEETYRALGAR